jgi:hypothetical protein
MDSEQFHITSKKAIIDINKPSFLMKLNREEYEKATAAYEGFQKWKTTRNSKRLDLERQH